MTKLTEVSVPVELKNRLRQGHPWIYRNQLTNPPDYLPSGAWLRVRCGQWSGIGLWDKVSPIAIRLFSRENVPDQAWVQQVIERAWENRAFLRQPSQKTNAYRWLFGEGDGLPGLTVDLYGQYAVLQTYAASLEAIKAWVVEALPDFTNLKGLVERQRHNQLEAERGNEHDETRPAKSRLIWGSAPPRNLLVEEHGLRFRANLFEGQKTGLFLDHRENRHFLENWCAGKTVLNCFSYTGAFSIYAARGGATRLVSCDVAPQAAEEAAQNFRLNGFDPEQHEFLAEDCFELLARYAEEKRQFDIVILDPPSFARSAKQIHAALRGYSRLNQLALKVVAPGGLLVSASCTSYVAPEQFRQMLAEAAAATNRQLLIIHDAGQPLDHPVPAHFLEGRYLKFVMARVQAIM